MEKEKFGDFTVMESAVSQLLGENFNSLEGGRDFPVMERSHEKEEEDDTTKDEEDFKDERGQEDSEDTSKVKDIDEVQDNKEEEEEEEDSSDFEDESLKDEDTEQNLTDKGLDEAEPEVAAYVQEKLFEKLGWEVEEGEEFKDVDEIVDYLEKVVEANSKPAFASEDIAKLNKFVTEGGDINNYFKVKGDLDLSNIDLESEYNQKSVVKEFLKEEGYSDAQINKKIKRYDESGILEDEALEAKESLEKIRQIKSDKLLQEQELVQRQALEQQQKFINDVTSTIDKLENIRGIKLSKTRKDRLKNELLSVDKEGKTTYQKSYQKDLVMNFIESGFFSLEKDNFIKNITKQAESKAAQNLKKKLQTTTKKGKTTSTYEDGHNSNDTNHSVLNSLFGTLSKP